MRRAARVDSNQKNVIDACRAIGAIVAPTHAIGKGFPDICVGYKGVNFLFEIKDGAKSPSQRKLTPDEEEWHAKWRGSVQVVNSPDEAIAILTGTA